MSSNPAGGDRQPDANPSGGNKRLHIWGRPIEAPPPTSPAATPANNSSAAAAPPTGAQGKALSSDDFQSNFPEQGVSLGDAVKTIKPEDILQVHRSACGRQGLMMGITAGAITGGLRFVWRGEQFRPCDSDIPSLSLSPFVWCSQTMPEKNNPFPFRFGSVSLMIVSALIGTPIKAANWAVGGFLGGAILGFERCQYLRRLERISMKRIVEVHQSDIVEKRRAKEEEDAQKQLQAAAASAKKWYKFW